METKMSSAGEPAPVVGMDDRYKTSAIPEFGEVKTYVLGPVKESNTNDDCCKYKHAILEINDVLNEKTWLYKPNQEIINSIKSIISRVLEY